MRRHKHIPLPAGVALETIHKGRIWVLHPTKGLRSRNVNSGQINIRTSDPGILRWFKGLRLKD